MSHWSELYRLRDEVFGHIPEPQWRILIDLAENGACRITSACIASGRAQSTALRHIDVLQDNGLVRRAVDRNDRRAGVLSLTARARNLFDTFNDTARGFANQNQSAPVCSLSFHGDCK